MLHYTQQAPPADLRAWIRLIWTLSIDASGPGEPELVIPDGCSELIFNLGDPFEHRALGAETFRTQPTSIVNGQLHGAVSLRSTGRVRLVGIRLQPWALGAVLGMPANLMTDSWFSLDTISAEFMPGLREHLLAIGQSESIVDVVALYFRELISKRAAPDVHIRQIVRHVGETADGASVSQISRSMGLSERTLQRLFATEVGLSAKQFSKILRVQQTVRLRQSNESTTWARAALDAGFYDQSHFNKDFRAIVGCAPTELIVEKQSFTDAFMSDLP